MKLSGLANSPGLRNDAAGSELQMNPIYDYKGQVALVTGAAKGMGLATARMFAESGASVVLADIDGDLAAKEAKRIVLEGCHRDRHRLRRRRRGAGGRGGRSRDRRVRPPRHGVQQCRHPGSA